MDIEAISGPGVTGTIQPILNREGPDPVSGTEALVLFSLDIRDRITISPEARRRYEDWRRKDKKKEREVLGKQEK